jgi:Domain of unknown function (DUF4062)
VFLSHTSELRQYPIARSFVAAAESAVSRSGDAVTDMAYFTARDDKPADYCEQRVNDSDVYVGLIVYGLGGVGKSELALHHAHAHRADYTLTWWITRRRPDRDPGRARRPGHPAMP